MPKRRGGRKSIILGLRWASLILAAVSAPVLALGAGGGLPSESQSWFEVRTGTFTLITTVHEQRAIEIARELDAFRRVLEREIPGLREPSRPVTIYAFDSRRTLKRHYPAAPRGVGGVFLRGGGIDVILVDAGTSLRQQHAYHEYVHFRLRDSFVALPAWLSEGLAYYFQTFRRVADDRAEVGAAVPGLRKKSSKPLHVLIDVTTASEHYATRSFARQSWALVHYLLSRSAEAEPPLHRLLSSTNHSRRGDAGLTDILDLSLPELEVAVDQYAGAGGLVARQIRVDSPTTTNGPTARRLKYAEILVRLAELDEAVGADTETARILFEEALKRSPENTRALLGTARSLVAAGDPEGALSRVDAALQNDPANAGGYLQRGIISMSEFARWRAERADGAPQVLHESLLKARHAFQHAIQLDPSLLAAVRQYARTFLFDPETRQPGIDACLGALAERNDLDLALTLVELYSDDGDRQSAHAARRQRVLPLRGLLEHHRTGSASWTRVETALARYDMLLAERLYDANKPDEAIAVLRETLQWATGAARNRVIALEADISTRSPG